MAVEAAQVKAQLKTFDFKSVFRDLGWNKYHCTLTLELNGTTYNLTGVAEKCGFVAFVCEGIPDRQTRLRIDRRASRHVHEHLIVYADQPSGQQIWQWVRREAGKPLAGREYRYDGAQKGDLLIQKLSGLAFSLAEQERLTITDVTGRVRSVLDVEKVTKRFYERFKSEHAVFLKFIEGIPFDPDLQWYTSLMLNRLMFVYFIQKKAFLDGDDCYLQNRLHRVRQERGKDKFHTFYRYFLLRLFHDGLGKAPGERDAGLEKLLGKVPYLNGGFFEVHPLETAYPEIDIPDEAFERLFAFFDGYRWHLDERPLRDENEINPDVVGYIFEKYINQKQMGAYYTKEDITEYITQNTIIPSLFESAEARCAIAFHPDGAVWRLLRDDPDRYIYEEVRHGVIRSSGLAVSCSDLPDFVQEGIRDPQARLKNVRFNLQVAPTGDSFRLPAETWREYATRRDRCLQTRDRLRKGEICHVNDLITWNLDLRQFAQDVILNAEGPELVRAFYSSIEGLSVLDPTCGSGAFLFAALNVLEPLYEACLDRMQAFVEDLEHSRRKVQPDTFCDFRKVLDQVEQHPNRRHFILKSIIINNLYGVDIMEEAVEICKLRLFLKLVAQIERVQDIEPLPDVDFNVRSGNTLVGFTSIEEVRKSQEGKLAFAAKEITRIEGLAAKADKVFQAFRQMQTRHGTDGKKLAQAKLDLRGQLDALDRDLDRYLAGEYGIEPDSPKKKDAFEKWKTSHQPFHWFVEFFGIMANGGFNVVIGNPPYVELTALRGYNLRNYACLAAGNLYAVVLERCQTIGQHLGRQGFIVPVSSVSTDRYAPLQAILDRRNLHYSSFDDRPSRLFEGLEHIRLTIHLIGRPTPETPQCFSTRYNKWNAVERQFLFHRLVYERTVPSLVAGSMPKLSSPLEQSIMAKLRTHDSLEQSYARSGKHPVFYSRKVGYFLQILDFEPKVLDGKGERRPPSEFKEILFAKPEHASITLTCLNSNLFYWFVTVFSDCRHVNKREVDAFPAGLNNWVQRDLAQASRLSKALMKDLNRNSVDRKMRFSHDTLTVQCIMPKASKPMIDELDAVLAQHYAFSDEEVDFIINYDIKYRMGVNGESDGEE